jgi:hypothetical protein
LDSIRAKARAEVDEWQTQMQLKPQAVGRICLFADGLSAEERSLTAVDPVVSLEAAVRESIERAGDTAVAVIPEGPYVIPVAAEN